MKTSLTKLSSSFLLLFFSMAVFAKPVAQVTGLLGTAFVITPEGTTSKLKMNQHLDEKSQIMVDEGGSITLNDYYDATYHLTGGTHMKFYNKSVQLKKGKTWIQSANAKHPLALTTANGNVEYWKGEFITTFDQTTSRTQVLVVNGEVDVSNVLNRNMKFSVSAGTFTLLDPEVESGMPRTPTKVGLQSLHNALAEFKNVPDKMNATPSRSLASVEDSSEAPVKRGEIIFISSTRLPASVSGGAHQYYNKKTHKKKALKAVSHAPVPIRIFGTSFDPVTPSREAEAPRNPASVPVIRATPPAKTTSIQHVDQEFAESLKKHSVEQPKYPKELDNLIQDLRSY